MHTTLLIDPYARSPHQLTVADVMTRDVVAVGPNATYAEVADTLFVHGVSGVPVIDEDGTLLGIVTEGDLIAKEAYPDAARRHIGLLRDLFTGPAPEWLAKSAARTVIGLMSDVLHTAAPTEPLGVVARRMIEGRHRRLPVVEGGHLVGIVSRHDLLAPFHRPDADIEAEITEMLADPMQAPEGHETVARVSKGVARLEGVAWCAADVKLLGAIVGHVSGVVAVENHVQCREQGPPAARRHRLGVMGP